jgi:hypothetical protein
MRYARLIRGGESPPPIFSDFRDLLDCSFRIANFGLLTSGSPTSWHLEIYVKPKKRLDCNIRQARHRSCSFARRRRRDASRPPAADGRSQKEAAVAAEKEAADKEAADKERASASVGGSCSKSAARTMGGAHGLLLSHSVDEADVAVADRRDEAARMLQYKLPPQQLQNLRADLSDDGDALV